MNRFAISLLLFVSGGVLRGAAAPAPVLGDEAPAVAGATVPEVLRGQELRPLSLASADFDGDGVADLAAGFGTAEGGVILVYRGNADALYPNSPEARRRRTEGIGVAAPFLPLDRVLALSAPPEFLAAGDFDADGRADIAAAAREGSVTLLSGDGSGAFREPRSASIAGSIDALGTGDLGRRDGLPDLVAAVADGSGPRVLVFEGPEGALEASPSAVALEERATSVAIETTSGRARITLHLTSGATRRLERADRSWRIGAEDPDDRAFPKQHAAPPPEAAAWLPMRVGSNTGGGVVLRDDGTLSVAAPAVSATFVVNVTTNLDDAAAGNGVCADVNGACSLRAAIQEANALSGLDVVTFAIPGSGVPVISVGALPAVTDAITIDGTTQSAGRVAVTGTSNGTLVTLNASGCTMRGLVLNGNGFVGMRVNGSNNAVEGNFFGTTADGTAVQGNFTYSLVVASGTGNRIGGTAPAARNVLAGASNLIHLEGGTTTIENNYVGTDVTGAVDLGATSDGIRAFTAPGNTIGGTAPGAGNLVSGNGRYGINLNSNDNLVQGNRVGTDATGTAAIPNSSGGVAVEFVVDTTIGGTAPGAGNLISGNGDTGLLMSAGGGAVIVNTLVQGNSIGVNASGSGALPNEGNGIRVVGGTDVVIGGTTAAARNIISGNLFSGIFLTKFVTVINVDIQIQGNFIGTDVTGTAAVGNLQSGIEFEYAEGAMIGGTAAGAANVISGNVEHGIDVSLTGYTTVSTIQGNLIGVNAFGTGPLGNGLSGVHFPLNTDVVVGGTGAGQANVIAFNGAAGIGSLSNRALHTRPNVVYSNGDLGHDLGTDGPTANVPGVVHNFPVITQAEDVGGVSTTVSGTLDAKASTNYQIHIYSSSSCDASGYGEGHEYRGSVAVSTDGAGHGVFSTVITPAIPGGRYVTAFSVAPDKDDASEFSLCRQLVGGPPPEDPPLEVFAATPPRGGNTGTVTIRIAGQGFVAGATALLERSGSADRVAQAVSISDGGSTLTATFDLTGAAEGAWDVTVNIPGDTATLPAAFTVEEGTEPELWADILGRGLLVVRAGREQTFFLVFGNRGNVDSAATVLQVTIPRQLRVTFVDDFEGSTPVVTLDVPQTTGGTGESTIRVYTRSIPGNSSRVIAFRLLTIEAEPGEFGEEVNVDVWALTADALSEVTDIETDPSVTVTTTVLDDTPEHVEWLLHVSNGTESGDLHYELSFSEGQFEVDPVFTKTVSATETRFDFTAAFPRGASELSRPKGGLGSIGEITGSIDFPPGFLEGIVGTAMLELGDYEQIATQFNDLSKLFGDMLPGILDKLTTQKEGQFLLEAGSKGPFENLKPEDIQAAVNNLMKGFCTSVRNDPEAFAEQLGVTVDEVNEKSCKELLEDLARKKYGCPVPPPQAPLAPTACRAPRVHRVRRPLRVFQAIDPNEKAGPAGTGAPAYYVDGETPLPYTITFENLETASAAAQEVVVTDQLDASKLDLSTFELGAIAFGTRVVDVPPGLTSFTADVDLRPGIDLIARVTAGLNESTGVATWHFFSIDPATGEPTTDPILGFLPPNVTTPEGEGHVSFFVNAKSGLASGAEIHNQASIVFDVNPPILTDDWFNTLDVTSPASQVAPLPASTCTGIAVAWSGSDAHSGVASYDIYVSKNGGPFDLWLTETTKTSTIYYGELGSSYAFYSIARDATGNVEAPGGADASTTIGVSSPLVDALAPTSGPASGAAVTLTGSGFEAGAQITVGGFPATGVTVTDPASMTATFPALEAGALYDVVATNPSTCSDTLVKGWFADFSDVDRTHPFHDFIEKILRRRVTAGCSSTHYCPGNSVTRAQMAVLLTKAKYNVSLVPPPATGVLFGDVPAGDLYAPWIEQIAREGVTAGCGSGNYCPGDSITREQMAVFLLKSQHGALYVPPDATGLFNDVPPGNPYAPWIEQLAAEQITVGCGDNNYCPADPVTRGQMAVLLAKTFGF